MTEFELVAAVITVSLVVLGAMMWFVEDGGDY